jgi:hypothetical protein
MYLLVMVTSLQFLSHNVIAQEEQPCNFDIVPEVVLTQQGDVTLLHVSGVQLTAEDIQERHDKESDAVRFEFPYRGSTVKLTIRPRSFKITSEKIFGAESVHDGDRLQSSKNYRLHGDRFERLPKKIRVSSVSYQLQDGNLIITLI